MKNAYTAIVLALVLFLLGGCSGLVHFATLDTVHGVTITGKDRVSYGSGDNISHQYLVYTDKETFKNTDTLWGMKFRSSDLQGRIKEGQVCSLKVSGFRLGLTSSYRNILSATCN